MADMEIWLNSLINGGILVKSGQPKLADATVPYVLSTPIQVCISAQAAGRLRRRYRPDKEIGGIMLAEPTVDQSDRSLIVNRIRFIRNLSDEPETKYLAGNQPYRLNQMHRCLLGTKAGKHYIPIWFHSHPIHDPNFSDAVMSYFEMTNSDQDMKVATRRIACESLRKSLSLPSALMLVTKDGGLFVGIYGGDVAPVDLKQAAIGILGDQATDLARSALDWGFGDNASGWRKLGGALGAIGAVVTSALMGAGLYAQNPKSVATVNELVTNLQAAAKQNKYFGMSKEGELRISIPKKS